MKLRIAVFILLSRLVQAQPTVGIVAPMDMDTLMARTGYSFLVESVSNLVSPRTVSNEQFELKLEHIKNAKTPIYALNILFPAEIKVVGPKVNEKEVLQYSERVFERCKRANIKLIIWGSGGSRKVPAGFSPAMAKLQFIELARSVAQLAAKYEIVLALENLNHTETNFINTVHDAFEMVTLVNHPNFRLCADLYHMQKENEPAAVLLSVGSALVHCDLAEKENRNPPGVSGDDFSDYFMALKKIEYSGKIVLECRWSNISVQALPAHQYLQNQLNTVWQE